MHFFPLISIPCHLPPDGMLEQSLVSECVFCKTPTSALRASICNFCQMAFRHVLKTPRGCARSGALFGTGSHCASVCTGTSKASGTVSCPHAACPHVKTPFSRSFQGTEAKPPFMLEREENHPRAGWRQEACLHLKGSRESLASGAAPLCRDSGPAEGQGRPEPIPAVCGFSENLA